MPDKVIRLDTKLAGWSLTLSADADGVKGALEGELAFADLASAVGLDLSGVPDELLPVIDNVTVIIDRDSKLVAAAKSQHGTMVLVLDRQNSVYLASLQTSLSIALRDLPVIDSVLPPSEDLTLTNPGVLIASKAFTVSDVNDLNDVLNRADAPNLPQGAIPQGKMFAADLSLAGDIVPLRLAFGTSDAAQNQDARVRRLTAAAAAEDQADGAPAPAATGKWIKVEKSFGPLNIRRVGLGYREQKLWLMLDAGFIMAGLDLELVGARLGFALKWPPDPPTPAIDGLDLDYHNGAITISGGLIETGDSANPRFDGQLILSAETFNLTALASYTKVEGHASLFAFAVLDTPIGGPPFCFVTGVAAGFGLNRDLTIPTLDKVREFPLVAAVNGASPFPSKSDPAQALQIMGQVIQPKYGENWLALGMRFTTFELLKSVALVTARFGTDVEIDLIGFSSLSVPSEAASSPIGYAELALLASFRPAEGTLKVNGQLTPASYVLSPDCHLVGGFAIWAWFKDQGEGNASEGDFVVTLGGYHPAYTPPKWYPSEPEIGANWQVTGDLLIKGGFYFALTPSCVMAGGFIDATWQSGDISAWFSAHADFLLSWKPFYYDAEIGISLGASFTVDLWITSFTITIHVGVDLAIEGPDFGGRATIDLSIISFTIPFGSSNSRSDAISWDEFKKTFLPKPAPAQSHDRKLRAFAAADERPVVCTTRIANGLIKGLTREETQDQRPESATHPDWIVNAELFELATVSAAPIKTVKLNLGGAGDTHGTDVSVSTDWNTVFGVGPVGIADDQFGSEHKVEISGFDFNTHTPTPFAADAFRIAAPARILKNVPKATWSKETALDDRGKPDKLLGQSTPTLDKALTGIALVATAETADATPLAMDLAQLQFDKAPPQRTFPLHTSPQPRGDVPTGEDHRMKAFTDQLAAAGPAGLRGAVAAALAAQGVISGRDTAIDVSQLVANAPRVLQSAPTLAFLCNDTKPLSEASSD